MSRILPLDNACLSPALYQHSTETEIKAEGRGLFVENFCIFQETQNN